MYAYVAAKNGQYDEYWKNYNEKNNTVVKPREIAYWRKHPNLHGWMENLWLEKTGESGVDEAGWSAFNGVELELTWDDLNRLEKDILNGDVANLGTTGFFFGDPSDYEYREQDLEFIRKAKAEIFVGLKVYYNSSW